MYYSLLTAVFTASLAAVVFVFGQFLLKLVIEPIQEQYRAIGGITHALLYHANAYEEVAPEQVIEARQVYRDLAAGLRVGVSVIPLYGLLSALGLVIPKERVWKASTALIGLSNSIGKERRFDDIERRREEITENLGIKYP